MILVGREDFLGPRRPKVLGVLPAVVGAEAMLIGRTDVKEMATGTDLGCSSLAVLMTVTRGFYGLSSIRSIRVLRVVE